MSTPTANLTPSRPFLLRRWPTLVGVVGCAALLLIGGIPHIALAMAIATCALIYVVWSHVSRQTRARQWLALAGFGAVTALALALDHRYAMYVIAAGLIGHGVWDVIHYRRREAVPQWYAELCAVVDVIVGVSVIALTIL